MELNGINNDFFNVLDAIHNAARVDMYRQVFVDLTSNYASSFTMIQKLIGNVISVSLGRS